MNNSTPQSNQIAAIRTKLANDLKLRQELKDSASKAKIEAAEPTINFINDFEVIGENESD